MKRISLMLLASTTFMLFSCNNNKTATDDIQTDTSSNKKMEDSSTAGTPMDSATMMKAWMTYMTPGEPQSMLAKHNGTWTQEVTTWMDPSKPPTKNTSIAENKMILGGRYQQSTSKGNFDGMPFEGVSTVGYDNARKIYQSSWIDNMGTGIMNMEGTWDEATKSINFKGTSTDPTTGKEMEVKEIFKIIDDNTSQIEMYTIQNGKEVKTMEIKSTRKK